jgi:outer membrane protein
MKRLVKITALLVLLFGALSINAQTKVKLGHIESDSLMKIMPGYDSAVVKIQAEVKTYQAQITTMQTEYDTKVSDYQTNLSTMSELIKQTKLAELEDLNSRIEKFTTSAQEAVSAKQTELVKPLIDKAKKAIADVAKENGFTYIFDSSSASGSVLLYTDGGEDIMPLVKKKLGIK